jgi:spermidine/putrescine transport system permease protein
MEAHAEAPVAPGGGESTARRGRRWLREHAIVIYAALAVAYMLLPIAVIAVFSVNNPAGKFNLVWNGFSLDAWAHPFAIQELTDALRTSLKLAALSTLIATAIGTLMAIALVRHEFHGRRVANVLIVIPMATPEVVIGAALLSMFLLYGVTPGFTTLLIAHVMFSISFVVVVVRSRLIGFDRSLEEAARDLGATSLGTFRHVTLPLIMPGVVGAALLAFALSIDDFVISNFNSGTTVTFPLYVFGANQRGIPVQVNVIATMLFAVTVLAMAFTVWQQRRAEKMAAVRPDQATVPAPAGATAGGG